MLNHVYRITPKGQSTGFVPTQWDKAQDSCPPNAITKLSQREKKVMFIVPLWELPTSKTKSRSNGIVAKYVALICNWVYGGILWPCRVLEKLEKQTIVFTADPVRLLASQQGELIQSYSGPLPDFRTEESWRTMPLVGGFSRGSPAIPRPFIPALLHSNLNHPHRLSRYRSLTCE
ncbi:hypothetical protein PR048_032066 [Dryococelus australis]|uniref:Uncharacterized protein n=1 Tax=Dryococelus australis TaxID=614101 RepID=A0ABQ9G217_9NEOP|nr:hypothetical protein PR048_032066 [Dryococelus australis]